MDNAVQVMRPGIGWNASCVVHWLFICSTHYTMHVLHRQCIQPCERERQLKSAEASSLAAGLSLLHHYSYSQASPLTVYFRTQGPGNEATMTTTTNLDEFDSLLCLVCTGSGSSQEDGRGTQVLHTQDINGNWYEYAAIPQKLQSSICFNIIGICRFWLYKCALALFSISGRNWPPRKQ